MSTLNSSSTLDQIEAAYADNASYAEDNSAAKARAFITACRLLLLKVPKQMAESGSMITLSPELIQKEKDAAELWVESRDAGSTSTSGGPSVTRGSFRTFRY